MNDRPDEIVPRLSEFLAHIRQSGPESSLGFQMKIS